jgi:hypothetical protein
MYFVKNRINKIILQKLFLGANDMIPHTNRMSVLFEKMF